MLEVLVLQLLSLLVIDILNKALIPFGKLWILLFSLKLWLNSRPNLALLLGVGEGKIDLVLHPAHALKLVKIYIYIYIYTQTKRSVHYYDVKLETHHTMAFNDLRPSTSTYTTTLSLLPSNGSHLVNSLNCAFFLSEEQSMRRKKRK